MDVILTVERCFSARNGETFSLMIRFLDFIPIKNIEIPLEMTKRID